MTPLQLRLKYKADTGSAPTWGHSITKDMFGTPNKFCNYKGHLKHEYTAWLENYFTKNGNGVFRRTIYLTETGNDATYTTMKHKTYYTTSYKEWLENRLCRIYDVLKKYEGSLTKEINNLKFT